MEEVKGYTAFISNKDMKEMDHKCVVTGKDQEPMEFEQFVVIGIKEGIDSVETTVLCVTDLPNLIKAAGHLNQAVEKAIQNATPEALMDMLIRGMK